MQDQLIDAILEKDTDKVVELLKEGVDPNGCIDEAGLLPLHFAIQDSSMDIIKALLTAGADPHLPSEDGETPFQSAKMHNKYEIINLLQRFIH